MKAILLLSASVLTGFTLHLSGASLSESTFTEVFKDVNVVAAATKTSAPAKVSDHVKAPDLTRTGAGSRAELTAPDKTITRLGANTVFSFEPTGRNMRLEKGSVLFHSPTGRGGGTIKTGGAIASVLGTTIMLAATADGGFKFIVLEGKGKATLPNGKTITLQAGQMAFVLPGGVSFSAVLDINLGRLVAGSQLVDGFGQPLPSVSKIQRAVQRQNRELARGRASDTGRSADFYARQITPGGGGVDQFSQQTAVHPPIALEQLGRLIGQDPNGKPGPPLGGPGGSGVVVVIR